MTNTPTIFYEKNFHGCPTGSTSRKHTFLGARAVLNFARKGLSNSDFYTLFPDAKTSDKHCTKCSHFVL